MKKVLAILVVLLMVPFVSMAATMSDADLAAVTGQSGVTITLSSMQMDLGLNTFTYGDYDGLTGVSVNNVASTLTNAGYVNVSFYPYPMHIGIAGLTTVTIDVGTGAPIYEGTSLATGGGVNIAKGVVNIGVTMTGAITVDAIVMNILFDGTNGAVTDYVGTQTLAGGNPYAAYHSGYAHAQGIVAGTGNAVADASAWIANRATLGGGMMTAASPGNTNCIGVIGISGISVTIPSLNIGISAH